MDGYAFIFFFLVENNGIRHYTFIFKKNQASYGFFITFTVVAHGVSSVYILILWTDGNEVNITIDFNQFFEILCRKASPRGFQIV